MRSGKPRRSWPQRLIIAGNVCVIVVALAVASSLSYFNTKLADVKRLALSGALTTPDAAPGAPQNFLIVGTDSDLGLSSTDPAVQGRGQITGARSDTIMILHLDPKQHSAALLSLQRDLWVEIAGQGISQKINSALGLGGEGTAGPATLIKTIEQNFKIPINHYVEIDFAGFLDLVDAVGGVTIDFDAPATDPKSGLDIKAAGSQRLDKDMALAYVRSRTYTRLVNGRQVVDPTADLGRIQRQQTFLRAVMHEVGSTRNPVTLARIGDAIASNMKVDDALGFRDSLGLARKLAGLDPETVDLPVTPTRTSGGADVLLLKQPAAGTALDRFR